MDLKFCVMHIQFGKPLFGMRICKMLKKTPFSFRPETSFVNYLQIFRNKIVIALCLVIGNIIFNKNCNKKKL